MIKFNLAYDPDSIKRFRSFYTGDTCEQFSVSVWNKKYVYLFAFFLIYFVIINTC